MAYIHLLGLFFAFESQFLGAFRDRLHLVLQHVRHCSLAGFLFTLNIFLYIKPSMRRLNTN